MSNVVKKAVSAFKEVDDVEKYIESGKLLKNKISTETDEKKKKKLEKQLEDVKEKIKKIDERFLDELNGGRRKKTRKSKKTRRSTKRN